MGLMKNTVGVWCFKMSRRFIFLEFLDPKINTLISSMMKITMGYSPKCQVHMTVRGPYRSWRPGLVQKYYQKIKEPIRIVSAQAGVFSNPDEEVVYIGVENPHLRSIWWKPDYPIKDFGFHPHISVYRGGDKNWAVALKDFFIEENFSWACDQYQLTEMPAKQMCLPYGHENKNEQPILSRLRELAADRAAHID